MVSDPDAPSPRPPPAVTEVSDDADAGPGGTDADGADDQPPHPPQSPGLPEWLAVVVVLTGIGLVIAQSFGLATINDSTLRIVLTAGIVLAGGTATIRAIAEAFA